MQQGVSKTLFQHHSCEVTLKTCKFFTTDKIKLNLGLRLFKKMLVSALLQNSIVLSKLKRLDAIYCLIKLGRNRHLTIKNDVFFPVQCFFPDLQVKHIETCTKMVLIKSRRNLGLSQKETYRRGNFFQSIKILLEEIHLPCIVDLQ